MAVCEWTDVESKSAIFDRKIFDSIGEGPPCMHYLFWAVSEGKRRGPNGRILLRRQDIGQGVIIAKVGFDGRLIHAVRDI